MSLWRRVAARGAGAFLWTYRWVERHAVLVLVILLSIALPAMTTALFMLVYWLYVINAQQGG
jgi:hypothetical protein